MEGGMVALGATRARTWGARGVSVPVLSNATQRTLLVFSRCVPPLISTPFLAAPASAATMDTGVEITSAQGQETTSSTSARYIHACQAAWSASGGKTAGAGARTTAAGLLTRAEPPTTGLPPPPR